MGNTPQIKLILFFTDGISLQVWDKVGSFEREVALYQQLQRHGIQITFVTYGDANDLQYASQLPGIKILCNRWGLPLKFYKRLLPLLLGRNVQQADILKTNQTNGAAVAWQAARLSYKPLIARCGYMWSEFVAGRKGEESAATQAAQKLETKVFNSARRIVVTTPAMAANISQRFPYLGSKIRVIPNYVDTHLFRPNPAPERDFELIFIGRLSPQKNVPALLEAIRPLPVRLALIGDGSLAGELSAQFEALDDKLFWQKRVNHAALPGYLNRASLFVLPSHYEGHPKTLIEAMACGLPVIGADVPGIRELIQHGETGWLCGTEPASIRAAITELLDRPQLRVELGSKARQYVLENFSLDRVVKMELNILQEVMGRAALE